MHEILLGKFKFNEGSVPYTYKIRHHFCELVLVNLTLGVRKYVAIIMPGDFKCFTNRKRLNHCEKRQKP